MRACGRCGYDNAEHLTYCFSCGRRLEDRGGPTAAPSPDGGAFGGGARDAAATSAGGTAPTAFAATVALNNMRPSGSTFPPSPMATGLPLRAFGALRYVFVYVRGRLDAEERKRTLVEEQQGVARLLEGALAELGQLTLDQAPKAPPLPAELTNACELVKRARSRHQAAISDTAVAEKFLAAEDRRLAGEHAAAENEWKACDSGAQGVDALLKQLEEERRTTDAEIERLAADPAKRNVGLGAAKGTALDAKRARLDEQYGNLRERAAALRASTTGARAKLDHALAARRQAAAAMAASLVGHNRERTDAEKQVRQLSIEVGRTAFRLRVAVPALAASYGRVERLQETIADRERQIAGLERTIGHYDARRLAAGLGLLTAIVAVVGASLWLVLH